MVEGFGALSFPLPDPFPSFVRFHTFVDAGTVAGEKGGRRGGKGKRGEEKERKRHHPYLFLTLFSLSLFPFPLSLFLFPFPLFSPL